jgi:lysine-specific demethylase/histidyl-hydroxylase NO66
MKPAKTGLKKRQRDADGGGGAAAAPAAPKVDAAREKGVNLLSWIVATAAQREHGAAAADISRAFLAADGPFEDKILVTDRGAPAHFAAPPPHAALARVLPNGIEWSFEKIRGLIAGGTLQHGTDLNIVKYNHDTKMRDNWKTAGAVTVAEFDEAFAAGWSLRFLRPQEHVASLRHVLWFFDEAMDAHTGMNSYLTPPHQQGFAPHYDDVDVFMLQLEGSKRWRLYDAFEDVHRLTRHSNDQFHPDDLPAPTRTVVLKAGDCVYLPRGTCHQGDTVHNVPGEGSLHITLSANRMHTFADLLLTLFQNKVETNAANDVAYRRTLPAEWAAVLGTQYNSKMMGDFAVPLRAGLKRQQRAALQRTLRGLCQGVMDDINAKDGVIDKAVDLFSKGFIMQRQAPPPPAVDGAAVAAPAETAEGDAEARDAAVLATRIRLVSRYAARLIIMGDEIEVFHCGHNAAVVMGPVTGTARLRFEVAFAPAVAAIVAAFPRAVAVGELPMPSAEDEADAAGDRVVLAEALAGTGAFVWA